MADDLRRWNEDRPFRILILLIGAHSCILGVAMLFATERILAVLGFSTAPPLFFPSQSGIFMLILGILYLGALAERSYVWAIVVSKALAVLFLFVHVTMLSAPPVIWAALAGDSTMLVAVIALLVRHRRLAPAR